MARILSEWKRYQTRRHGIRWQENFFDHRLRNVQEYLEKAAYIRRNPVVKELCETPEMWRWVLDAGGTRRPGAFENEACIKACRDGPLHLFELALSTNTAFIKFSPEKRLLFGADF